jgi:hypothetical protein
MAKWKGRVRPLTKKFINEFSEKEIEYLEYFVEEGSCCSCVFCKPPVRRIPRFHVGCNNPNSLCEEILGIYKKRTDYGCGCHELGEKDALEHLRRITKKWRQLNGGVK